MHFQIIAITVSQSPSPSHYNLQPKQKTTIILLIVNSNKLNHKDQQKKNKIACCHQLLHIITTIEEGDAIAAVTFFTSKPAKEGVGC